MREYEVNTRVTERGSHVFTLKGVSNYHRKEPFTISDIIYEVLEQTWPYRKYNVVMNAEPHDALSRRLAVCAKYPIEGAEVTWGYCYSDWSVSNYIDVGVTGVGYAAYSVGLEDVYSVKTTLLKANALLNSTGINLTWFDWEDEDENV